MIRITVLFFYLLIFCCSEAFAQAKASTAVKIEEKIEKNYPPIWTSGSLMFDKKTYEWITEAIKSRDQQIPIEILLPSLFPANPATENIGKEESPKTVDKITNLIDEKLAFTTTEAPAFHLKSILYFAPDNWSVWINDKKISDKTDKALDNLTVMKTSRRQAVIFWEKTQIDKIYPDWKSVFIALDGDKYVSPEKNIVVDASTGNISFILKPNQSLISKTLEIIEGPAKPLSDNNKSSPNTSSLPRPGGVALPTIPENQTLKALGRTSIDTLDAIKNIEVLKSMLDQNKAILDQNVEKLR